MDIEMSNTDDLEDDRARAASKASHDESSASFIKPIIAELVRTQVCFPNIKLLVDRIAIVKVPSDPPGLEAYRMWLTDREKSIQAVVKRRLHKWLSTLNVREGSYVVLKEYHLARGKRLHGEGDVFYLAISDFYPIGEEQRYNSSTEDVSAGAREGSSGPQDQDSAMDEDETHETEAVETEHSLPRDDPAEAHQTININNGSFSLKSANMEPMRRKREIASLYSGSNVSALASPPSLYSETPSTKITREKLSDDAKSRSAGEALSSTSMSNMLPEREFIQAQAASPELSASRLQLSTLASVTGTNVTRNQQVNILAMIDHVSSSTVKPTTAPLKRDVRIVDSSTEKKVTLSVFVDPVNFLPKEYDIILFRNLTTHDFSGGNLNAYPKKCKDKDWYIINPYGIEGCDMMSMESFREDYRKTKASQLS